jgi:hypothetical protein
MDETVKAVAENYQALRTLVPLAVPVIKTTLESWLAPAIEKVFRSRQLANKTTPNQISKSFEEYLLRTYARLSFMNTIVFGNQQRRIQDLYVPLTVRTNGPGEKSFEIAGWREDFIPAFKRVVITDTAGMGKSTVLKWLFLCSLGTSKGIPIFVELRTLSSSKPILERIHEELCPIDKPFDKELLLRLLSSGQFIFFLDGFDEVAFEDRRTVTEDIQQFISKAFGNLFVLASRHETALGSFGEFREFSIKPLSKQEAYQLLRRYDESNEHAEALIEELEASKYEQLKDLMSNPMLVSLLYKAYSYKPKVPFKKQIFYRQVYDALFDMHDSTKGGAFVRKKHSGLDIEEFHLVMRDLGFVTAKLGKIEYGRDEIGEMIKKVRERNTSVLFPPAALLDDLITTVPLFNREGEHFKWAHKSVQDYFASQFIALDTKGNEETVLQKIYDGGHCRRFENILDLLHDTDNKSFRRVLLARWLKDYIAHHETRYRKEFPGVPASAIETRRQLTFGFEVAFSNLTAKQLSTVALNKMEKIIRSSFRKWAHLELSIKLSSGPKMRHILIGVHRTSAGGLLPLLASRKYPYVNKPEEPGGSARALPAGGPHLVTDDPKSVLNRPKVFEAVNNVLRAYGYLVSIDDVRRTLKSIETEERDSQHVNQLLDNL